MTLTRLFAKSYQTTYKFEFFAMNTKLTILSTLTLKTFSSSKTNYLYYNSIWGSLDQGSNAQPTELTCHMIWVHNFEIIIWSLIIAKPPSPKGQGMQEQKIP